MDERLAAASREADLVLALGGRLGEVATRRYTLLDVPRPRQTLVHVHPDPDELGCVYEPDLADRRPACPSSRPRCGGSSPSSRAGGEWTQAARADYVANLRHEPMEGPVDLGEIMAFLRQRLPDDAIQTCGAGNFTRLGAPLRRVHAVRHAGLPRAAARWATASPAAVAAKLVHPDRIVVCLTGDGDFVMSSPELATAVQYELPIVVLLVNNGMYGTIRMHQERQFPGRVIGTDLVNPDFAALARAVRRLRRAGRADGGLRGGVRAGARLRACRRCSSCASTPSGSARAISSASSRRRRS